MEISAKKEIQTLFLRFAYVLFNRFYGEEAR